MPSKTTAPLQTTLPLPPTGFIRLPQVLAVIPVGRATWWAGVRSGRFPKPVKLTPGVTAWAVEDIRELINHFHRSVEQK